MRLGRRYDLGAYRTASCRLRTIIISCAIPFCAAVCSGGTNAARFAIISGVAFSIRLRIFSSRGLSWSSVMEFGFSVGFADRFL